MYFYYNYNTRMFMTAEDVAMSEEELYLACYVVGPRNGRPGFKYNCMYSPEIGIHHPQ